MHMFPECRNECVSTNQYLVPTGGLITQYRIESPNLGIKVKYWPGGTRFSF